MIALNDGEVLHAAALYQHPENQTIFQAMIGASTAAASVITFLVGLALLIGGRRRSRRGAGLDAASAPPERYAPPTVRPAPATWPASVVLGAVLATVVGLLALTIGTSGR